MRIVVKVGTSTLAHPGGLLNIRHTEDLVKVWSDIQNAGHQLIVVSSAATGLGAGKLQIEKPGDLVTKQAAAAVGQCELMYTYDRLFGQYNHTVAQMLLGSARMVLETGKHPGELKDAVCSPGGSTIQGVRLLEERAFRGAVTDAVLAAFEKTKDLGKK